MDFCNNIYDIFTDFLIPIVTPLFIWGLTWYFGAEKAASRGEKAKQKAALNNLKSIVHYTMVSTLRLYEEIFVRKKIADNFANATEVERKRLFSHILFEDIYNKMNLQEYMIFTLQCPQLSANMLQTKDFLLNLDTTISLINKDTANVEKSSVFAHVEAFKENLPATQLKLAYVIKLLNDLIDKDIPQIAGKLSLGEKELVNLSFRNEQKLQIEDALKILEIGSKNDQ